MIYLAAVGLVLGVLVFVHEFGHYAVAKLCGVRVEVFSLGFGKRLWGFRRGDTDYRISLLPLGGYVKMSGENPMEERTGDPGEFTSHPRWQRFLIAIAGPAMNIILAIVVLTGVYMVHNTQLAFEKLPVDVLSVTSGSPAEKAGIRTGDRIVQINDIQNPTWANAMNEFAISPRESVDVVVKRGDQFLHLKMVPEATGPDLVGEVGLVPPEVVGTLERGKPAESAGMQVGDAIVSANGTPIHNLEELQTILQQVQDHPLQVTVWRDGKEFSLKVTPELMETSGTKRYRLGFSVGSPPLHFQAAAASAVETCKENSLLIFRLVGRMIETKASIRQMSGPIGITKISGQAAKQGFVMLLFVMALISLNLAIFNLLPIPILDGGLMLMLLIEGIMRRDIKQEIKERVYQAAFVFLIVFAAVVIYNDLAKTLPGHLL